MADYIQDSYTFQKKCIFNCRNLIMRQILPPQINKSIQCHMCQIGSKSFPFEYNQKY